MPRFMRELYVFLLFELLGLLPVVQSGLVQGGDGLRRQGRLHTGGGAKGHHAVGNDGGLRYQRTGADQTVAADPGAVEDDGAMPISVSSPMVQPWRMAPWPTVTFLPTVTGRPGSTWTTQLS